jgi:hypothetical protein
MEEEVTTDLHHIRSIEYNSLVMQARTRLKPPNPEAMLLAYIRPGALHSKPSKAAGDTPVQLCTTTCSLKNKDYLHPKIHTYGGCALSEGPGH